jgi:hypothetical protein
LPIRRAPSASLGRSVTERGRAPQETQMQSIILWLLGVPIIAIIALKLFGVF